MAVSSGGNSGVRAHAANATAVAVAETTMQDVRNDMNTVPAKVAATHESAHGAIGAKSCQAFRRRVKQSGRCETPQRPLSSITPKLDQLIESVHRIN